jgi:hypothetical protein
MLRCGLGDLRVSSSRWHTSLSSGYCGVNEADLKRELMKLLRLHRPQWVYIRHEDRFTSGIPDLSVTGNGRTTWWEVKLVKDGKDIVDKKIQEGITTRLAENGFCAYIIYEVWFGRKRTHIIHPNDLKLVKNGVDMLHVDGFHQTGHDHAWVMSYIMGAHAR